MHRSEAKREVGLLFNNGSWLVIGEHPMITLHQLSPYIGKFKSSMAAGLIRQFTSAGDVLYDPPKPFTIYHLMARDNHGQNINRTGESP
ncbi:MAG TPA: hypothetical protein VN829_06995 [Dongiaceae bacterium]|nr:hypothetical protein [Dongiaceae bacterium]